MHGSSSSSSSSSAGSKVLVLDSGGAWLRGGLASGTSPAACIPNTVARLRKQPRIFVGDETVGIVKDPSQLRYTRPIERGFVVDTEVQALIWERLLSVSLSGVIVPSETTLVLSVPPFLPSVLESDLDDLVFERFGFAAVHRATGAELAAVHLRELNPPAPIPFSVTGTGVIIDTGFSGTIITPFYDWRPIATGIVRLDVGGKALTNYLKELISFRQYNMMEDTWLVNALKERLCFVAQNYELEMEVARRLAAPGVAGRLKKFTAAAAAAATAAAASKSPKALVNSGNGVISGRHTSVGGAHSLQSGHDRPAATKCSTTTTPKSTATDGEADGDGHPQLQLENGHGGAAAQLQLQQQYGPHTPSVAIIRPTEDGAGLGVRREFVLPDHVRISSGYVRGAIDDPKQIRRAARAAAAAAIEVEVDSGHAPAAAAAASAAVHTGDSSAQQAVLLDQQLLQQPQPQVRVPATKRPRDVDVDHTPASSSSSSSSSSISNVQSGAAADASNSSSSSSSSDSVGVRAGVPEKKAKRSREIPSSNAESSSSGDARKTKSKRRKSSSSTSSKHRRDAAAAAALVVGGDTGPSAPSAITSKAQGGKKGTITSTLSSTFNEIGGDEEDDEEDEDEMSVASTSSSSSSSSDSLSGDDDDYKSGAEKRKQRHQASTSSDAAVVATARASTVGATSTSDTRVRRPSRASTAGVSALTASMRRDGVVEFGEEGEGEGASSSQVEVGAARPRVRVTAATAGGATGSLAHGDASSSSSNSSGAKRNGAAAAAASAAASAADDAEFDRAEDDLQVLVMNGERMSVPEALFRPSDVSQVEIERAPGPDASSQVEADSSSNFNFRGRTGSPGLHHLIARAIGSCPPVLQPMLWGSIVLIGGNARMPGLEARLASELRPLAPTALPVRVYTPPEPDLAVWRGGAALGRAAATASTPAAVLSTVSYKEWALEGSRATRRAFRLRPAGTGPLQDLEAGAAVDASMMVALGGSAGVGVAAAAAAPIAIF